MILELHGSIEAPDYSKLVHRRMLTKNNLLYWAADQRAFVSVEEAFRGEGTALTIDDGTYAAYETALALSALGHQVTLYINMLNVLTRRDYFFHVLSALLDKFFEITITKRGNITIGDKEIFRSGVKAELMKVANETACNEYLEKFCQKHSIEFDYLISKELQCIGVEECKTLAASGVSLGNHCYDHFNPPIKALREFEQSVSENASLLQSWFNVENNFCAIPFGKWQPPSNETQLSKYVWLLADRSRQIGSISQGVWNRRSIDTDADLEILSHE